MTDTNGNDPAMPTSDKVYGGLTKREYFAGLAMQGLLAGPNIDDLSADQVASDAAIYADALIAELSK